MSDLIEFLRARLDEDEAVARAAADEDSGKWFVGDKWNVYDASNFTPESDIESNQLMAYGNLRTASEHIARHDPARVLAEVGAKREVVRLAVQARRNADLEDPEQVAGPYIPAVFVNGFAAAMEHVLRVLAAPYASHPDYLPEWAPTT